MLAVPSTLRPVAQIYVVRECRAQLRPQRLRLPPVGSALRLSAIRAEPVRPSLENERRAGLNHRVLRRPPQSLLALAHTSSPEPFRGIGLLERRLGRRPPRGLNALRVF